MACAQEGALGSRSIHEPGDAEEAEEHAHGPRHGGYFGDAEDLFHYELVLQPDGPLLLYVNDEHNEPLDVRVLQGRWTLSPDSPTPVTGSFLPSDDGAYFSTALPPPDPTQPTHVLVEVLKDDQWVGMEFFLLTVSE